MKKILIVEVVKNGTYYHSRYATLAEYGAELFFLTCSKDAQGEESHLRIAADTNLKSITDAAAHWHSECVFDGVLTLSESSVIATAAVAQALDLPGTGLVAACNSRNKILMRRSHQIGNAPHPEFAMVESVADACTAAGRIGYPLVLKPTLGGASQLVTRVSTEFELRQAFVESNLNLNDMFWLTSEVSDDVRGPSGFLLEGFLDGPEFLVDGYVWDGELVVGSIVDRVSEDNRSFDEDINIAPTSLSASETDFLREAVDLGVKAQGVQRGVFHAELRFHNGKPIILEIAARPGGEL